MPSKSKYPPLPVMQCDPGCGECCGPVICTQGEFEAVVNYAADHGIAPLDQGLTCPWYQQGKCAVHDVRPALCHLFGHVDNMECCKGYNVNIQGTLLRKWNDKMKGASRLLHEVIVGWTVKRLETDLKLTRASLVPKLRRVD